MTSKEIASEQYDGSKMDWLREIAYQLAVMNEKAVMKAGTVDLTDHTGSTPERGVLPVNNARPDVESSGRVE